MDKNSDAHSMLANDKQFVKTKAIIGCCGFEPDLSYTVSLVTHDGRTVDVSRFPTHAAARRHAKRQRVFRIEDRINGR